MSATLSDVIHRLNLRPGQIHREMIDGYVAELRLGCDDEPTPELAEMVMLDGIPSYPFPITGGVTTTVTVTDGPLPDPPIIPTDWEAE